MQLHTALILGAVSLQTALVSSFTCSGPVAISPRFAFVSQHPYRQAVDNSHALRTPLCASPKALVEESDEALLTPETYAKSQSAKNEVEHIIMDAAVEAFQTTDFTTEPHLPPELESCEVIYDNTSSLPTPSPSDSFQRSLLAQQFAYNTKKSAPVSSEETQDVSKKQEAFQRSLLAARLSTATDTDTVEKSLLEAEEEFLQKDSQMNWMESEVRAASLGAKESLPFHDSAAMATRSADLADAENTAATTTPTASTSATDQVAAAKKKIGITPVVGCDLELAKKSGRRPSKQPVDIEIQSYVTKRGVEITKERMRQKLGVGIADNKKDLPAKAKGLVVRKLADGKKEDSVTTYLSTGEKSKVQTAFQSALQKLLQTGLMKRFRQPKVLIASVLLAVLFRSLALAWFGNPAMRLK